MQLYGLTTTIPIVTHFCFYRKELLERAQTPCGLNIRIPFSSPWIHLKFRTYILFKLVFWIIFMYQFHHNLFPDDLLEPNYFTMNNEIHNYNTRGATNNRVGLVNTCLAYNTIRIQGALLWNTLPTFLKNAPSINVFKRSYKKMLMDNYHS